MSVYNLKLLMMIILWVIFWGISISKAQADESRVGFGVFTEHYQDDDSRYNENNELFYFTHVKGENTTTFGTFRNSHFVRSYFVSAGKEWNKSETFSYGVSLAVIKGYEGYVTTTVDGLLFVPVLHVKTWFVTHKVLANVYSVSINIEI